VPRDRRVKASREDEPRVLFVTTLFLPHVGGIETHAYEVARRLARKGVDITVLTTDTSGRLPVHEKIDGIAVSRVDAWPRRRDWAFAPGVYRAITCERWDVVHCQGYRTFVAPLTMLAALRSSTPYVVTLHSGGHSSRLRTLMRRAQPTVLRPLLARAERIIAVSHFEAALFQRRLRIPSNRFVVIPNGSDLPEIGDRPPKDRGLIVSLGRLERYKGHHRVIAALPYVVERYPDARLQIVGTGPFESQLRRLATDLGVGDRVEITFVPAADRRRMAQVLARASLVTLLSEYESHGVAVAEAVALGCPVLVAATSALKEFAERGQATVVALDASPADTAAAIVEQLFRPRVGSRPVLPTWDECATRLLALYKEVVAGQNGRIS
jgi:glycosyltransferase involved in cell wall biosynthesis